MLGDDRRMSDAGADFLRKELLTLFGRLTDGPLTLEAGLTASATVRKRLEDLQAELVRLARDEGASWASIGAALGVTTQAAHQRFATPVPRPRR